MVLVFFVVNLLRIDLYDAVKEIKKGRDTMKTIIKRSILDYLKNPVLWIGLIIIVASIYQCLSSYLQIHYIKPNEQVTQNDVALGDADVMDGYIPTSDDKERRREWEDTIRETLMDTSKNGFGFSRQEADDVVKKIQNMDVKTASEFLESQYGYYNAIYAYEDLEIHKGTTEEINHYIEQKLSEHSFSWYFAKKFTDFAGLHMAFFATVLLSFLFIQDTRKSTYELLHTKPVTAIQCFVFLAKTGQCKRRYFGHSDIPFIFHCNVRNHLALEYMLCDFVYIDRKYVGRYRMFIWNCHWSYIERGQFIFRESGIVFFQLV